MADILYKLDEYNLQFQNFSKIHLKNVKDKSNSSKNTALANITEINNILIFLIVS